MAKKSLIEKQFPGITDRTAMDLNEKIIQWNPEWEKHIPTMEFFAEAMSSKADEIPYEQILLIEEAFSMWNAYHQYEEQKGREQVPKPLAPKKPTIEEKLANAKARGRKPDVEPTLPIATPTVRKPPKGDEQPDFFVPTLYDLGTRDSRSLMDVAVFRLGKKNRRASDVIRYELSDGYVEVSSGPAGMASVWDYDIVLMAVSHLTEAMNRYREGKGNKPGRVFRPNVADVLKFCRRSNGGKQKDDLVETCLRLNTTHVAMQRSKKTRNGKTVTVSEGEALISRYKITKNEAGNPEDIEIELAEWMYREVVDGQNPDVLTVHPDYFLIDPGIGRFVYRLARRAAGRAQAKWAFQTIFERSGSTGTLKKFAFTIRGLIKSNDMPEYELTEEAGQAGPLLVMTYRGLILPSTEEATGS